MVEVKIPEIINDKKLEYAGFWIRLVAYFIDNFILGFLLNMISLIVAVPLGLTAGIGFAGVDDFTSSMAVLGVQMILLVTYSAIVILYYTLMESSKYQGTLGKMVLGLKVVDYNGNRIGFGRAVGRYFSKILSAILFIGYIMIMFDNKKQGLHDQIAKTYVVKKSNTTKEVNIK